MRRELGWERDGCRLVLSDYGGAGPTVLLLHGLAGHAGEWAETAMWLRARARVVAPDARGHGGSERRPADVSREAHVADAVDALARAAAAPTVVVGQSLGGVTALLVAARHPELVRGLVLVEASPAGADDDAEAQQAADDLARALESWPVPFGSREDAHRFFAGRFGSELAGAAWARGLEERGNGWWPRFEVAVMRSTLEQAARSSYWGEWDAVACPVMLVRAPGGMVPDELVAEMRRRQPEMQVVDVPDARHDLHLDAPHAWRHALDRFLDLTD